MSETENNTAAPTPERPWFQFTLRTLLLLFVVLASSLAVFGAWGIAAFALSVWLAVVVNKAQSLNLFGAPPPTLFVYFILAVLCLPCLFVLVVPQVGSRPPGNRSICMFNLKQISLALENYRVINGSYPPAYIADKNGKPMHSWRVLILPFLDLNGLYKMYSFNEPWDGPNNKKLLASRPSIYACPSDSNASSPGNTQTSYVAVVGPRAAWSGAKPRTSADFTAGMSNTVMLTETANSGIAWTEPSDLSLEALAAGGSGSSALSPSSFHSNPSDYFSVCEPSPGANAAMADGSVHYLPPGSLSAKYLPKLLQCGGYNEDEVNAHSTYYEAKRLPNWPNIAALVVWVLSVLAL